MLIKVAILNRSEKTGGAAKFAYRLSNHFNSSSISDQNIKITYVFGVKDKVKKFKFKILNINFVKIIKLIEDFILNQTNTIYPFSLNIFPTLILKTRLSVNYDLLHLNWVGAGYLSIKSIGSYSKPIIWTLHDSWAFTGGCHLPYDCVGYKSNCDNCPQLLSKNKKRIPKYIHEIKLKKLANNDNIVYVCPSNYLARKASESSILQNSNVIVIPNGIDTDLFIYTDKDNFRNALNIPLNKKVLLFGSVNSSKDRNKGLDIFISSLGYLDNDLIEIIIFGSDEKDFSQNRLNFKIHFVGNISDEKIMAKLYSSADVTIVPSRSENLSFVIMESMSCSTPVVAFDIGGNSDLIDHKINGYLAKPFSSEDLANGIKEILGNEESLLFRQKAREKITKYFSMDVIANKYKDLYIQMLNSNK